MVLAKVLDLVDTWYSTLTGLVSPRLSYTNVYTVVTSCMHAVKTHSFLFIPLPRRFFSGLQKVGVEDEERKGKKKVAHLPSTHEEVFSEARLFSFLFFRCGRQRQTRSSRSKSRHTPPPVCGFTFHWLCPPLQSLRVQSNHIVPRLSHKAMNPQVQQYPPQKNPYFEDFKRVLRGNSRLQGLVAYSQMNYGAQLQF